MAKYNWSWADYEREVAKERRRSAKKGNAKLDQMVDRLDARLRSTPPAARRRQTKPIPQGLTTADSASGCEGRAAAVSNRPAEGRVLAPSVPGKARQSRVSSQPCKDPLGDLSIPFDRGAKIDISVAPSAMEVGAAKWRGKGAGALDCTQPDELPAGEVLCRCGSRHGRLPGPVPHWFGQSCIEADCELRASKHG